jgi:hypothetical protein
VSPISEVLAQPDFYSFTLDNNGNLAPRRLYVLKNDKGSGIRIVSVQPSPGFVGILNLNTGMDLTYEVRQYR